MPDLQWYPWNLYLINNGDDIVVFLGSKVFNSDISNIFSGSKNAWVYGLKKQKWVSEIKPKRQGLATNLVLQIDAIFHGRMGSI